jgi:hypothetical protein
MHFEFIKQLDTSPDSIFYSLIKYKTDKVLAVGRRKFHDERIIKFMFLNYNLDVIKDDGILLLRGEDPRCFIHNDHIYVQDNFWNDMHLINITDDFNTMKINISGKNISFISHANRLFFIHYMCPFVMYELCLETGEIFPVDVYDHGIYNLEYRGGTPAYKLNDNLYYGFGHRTYTEDDIIKHDIFYWEVDFSHTKPFLNVYDIEQPPGSLNICDPTSVIEIEGRLFLITAESEHPWFRYQDYQTNVYEIVS